MESKKRVHVLDKYPGPFGTTTNPGTPDQLLEFEKKLWEGIPTIEIGAVSAAVAQSIPKKMYEEIASKAKITGTKLSVHAPIQDIDLAGFNPNEQRVTEEFRELTKYRLKQVLDRAVEMAEKLKYNIPVNVHTSVTGYRQWDKRWEDEIKEKLKDRIQREGWKPWYFAKREALILEPIGKPIAIAEGKKIKTPLGEEIITVKDEVDRYNKIVWSEQLGDLRRTIDALKSNLTWVAEHAGEALYDPSKVGKFYNALQYIETHFNTLERNLKQLYDWVYKYGTEEQKRKVEKLKQKIDELNKLRNKISEIEREIQRLTSSINQPVEKYREFARYIFDNLIRLQYYRFNLLEQLENYLGKITALYGPPKIVKPLSEITLEKASETVADIMSEYIAKYYREPYKIPKFVIENVGPEFNLSRAEELAELIKEARKKTIEKLMQNEKLRKELGEEGIKKLVNKLIGATLDVGHIYKLKSMGYSEKEIMEEVKKIAPYVKHVHITDNYGDYDTHLVPGMAEVPYKKMLEEIKKAAEEEGLFIISEAGGWYAQFSAAHGAPTPYLYANLNIPIEGSLAPYTITYEQAMYTYPMVAGGISPPYAPTGYPLLPEYLIPGGTVTQYHPLGVRLFSMLPPELGGSGGRQTFTGRPLE